MRYKNKFNVDLFNNPLRRNSGFLQIKNQLESVWYDDEAQSCFTQLGQVSDLMPMDRNFENWFASFYDNASVSHLYDRDYAFFSRFPKSLDMRILELGSGNGRLSRFFIRRGFDVCSIDVSNEYYRFLRKSDPTSNPLKSCAEILPFKDKSFDIITTFVALHHFNLNLCLPEIMRTLKDDGRGIFIEPFSNSRLLYKLRKLIPVADNESPGGGGLRISDLKRKLVNCGFNYDINEYELITRLERIPFAHGFQNSLRRVECFLLSLLPFLAHFARTAVIEIRKNR
jgi:SAM-dependent methyltransferase